MSFFWVTNSQLYAEIKKLERIIMDQFAQLQADVATLTTSVTGLLAAVQTAVTNITAEINALKALHPDISAELTAIEADIATLGTTATAVASVDPGVQPGP